MKRTTVITESPTFATASAGAIKAGIAIRGRNQEVFKAGLRFAVWLLAAKELARAEARAKCKPDTTRESQL